MQTPSRPSRPVLYWLAVCLVLAAGLFLRLQRAAGFQQVGFDENIYRIYVNLLWDNGLGGYPELVASYREKQAQMTGSFLPPTRFLYIGTTALWLRLTGRSPDTTRSLATLRAAPHADPTLGALHEVAALFSCLSLLVAFGFLWRSGDAVRALGVTALFAVAPLQLHMSQHALVDGFFAFWAMLALWCLWETLRYPDHGGWLVALGTALALMVCTKENAAFVYVGMLLILATNRWAGFGTITPRLLLVMLLGPLAGVAGLVTLAGGLPELVATYQLSVSKNFTLEYAILTGDGPWYRYLLDLMTVSPLILLLAAAGAMQAAVKDNLPRYLLLFTAGSYAIMCNLKYGMNVRYACIWDLPLRVLAWTQLTALCARLPRRGDLVLAVATVLLCAFDLRQFVVFTVEGGLYELVPEGLLHAVRILKS